MLTTTITVPLAGKLSDMYGRRPMLIAGVFIFTIGSLLSGMAPSIEWLIAGERSKVLAVVLSPPRLLLLWATCLHERGRWRAD